MVNAAIPPSITEETVRRILGNTDLKWTHFQRKVILTKNDLKLRLKFAWKVSHKRSMRNYEIRKPMELERVELNLVMYIAIRSRICRWSLTYKSNKFHRSKWKDLWNLTKIEITKRYGNFLRSNAFKLW